METADENWRDDMSIATQKDNTIYFECDECNRRPEIYFGDFQEAWAAAKKDGWRCYKDDTGAWCHKCPHCTEEK